MELPDKFDILADAAKLTAELLRRHLADARQQMNLWPELRAT